MTSPTIFSSSASSSPASSGSSSSASSDAMVSASDVPSPNSYRRVWKAFPRDLGYLSLFALLLPTAYALLWWLFWTGIGTLVVVVGFFLVLACLPAARLLGDLELKRIRWAQAGATSSARTISPVRWNRGTESNPFLKLFAALSNPHYWLYLLHGLASLIVGGLSVVITLAWIIVGLGLVLSPAYVFWVPVSSLNESRKAVRYLILKLLRNSLVDDMTRSNHLPLGNEKP